MHGDGVHRVKWNAVVCVLVCSCVAGLTVARYVSQDQAQDEVCCHHARARRNELICAS